MPAWNYFDVKLLTPTDQVTVSSSSVVRGELRHVKRVCIDGAFYRAHIRAESRLGVSDRSPSLAIQVVSVPE